MSFTTFATRNTLNFIENSISVLSKCMTGNYQKLLNQYQRQYLKISPVLSHKIEQIKLQNKLQRDNNKLQIPDIKVDSILISFHGQSDQAHAFISPRMWFNPVQLYYDRYFSLLKSKQVISGWHSENEIRYGWTP